MTNTVMATNGRKGTFLILTALEKNPHVFTHEQLFSEPDPAKRHVFVRNLTNYQLGERCFDRKLLDVSADTAVILPCAPGMFESEPSEAFWTFVDERRDIQLLHLRRRNLLKGYVSGLTAAKTGVWSNRYPILEPEPAVQVDPILAAKHIRWDLQQSLLWEERYKDRPNLVIFYEDMVANIAGTLNTIQQFLQVPVMDIYPRTRKQATRGLPEAISNYEELTTAWKGTDLEQYL